MLIRVTFHKPLPDGERTDQFDLYPNIYTLDISTQLPGGWDTCIIGLKSQMDEYSADMQVPFFPDVQDIYPRGHVEIKSGEFSLFEGTITKLKWTGSQITEITVRGYGITGLNDGWYRNNEVNVSSSVAQIQASAKTAGQIVSDAILSSAPLLRLGLAGTEFFDPGTIYVPGSFYGLAPSQILESITKAGSSLNVVWDTWVYEDRVLNLRPRQLVGDPDYKIPLDKTVEWVDDYEKIAGNARVEFQLPDWDHADRAILVPDHNGNFQTADQTNQRFVDRYGFQRSVYIKGGELTASVADQFRDTNLAYHEDPETTSTITRTSMRGLELGEGTDLPAWMARAGQWVKVTNKPALVIVRTNWKWPQYEFQAEIGKSAQKWDTIISFLQEVTRHVIMGTNPLSGGRA